MSRRDAIRMTDAEVAAFLEEERTVTVATNGRDGFPHLMPLWFVCDVVQRTSAREVRPDESGSHRREARYTALDDLTLRGWTYASSQKVKNLERDPRCTLQVEAGTEYSELRGVMFKAECELVRDVEDVWAIGARLAERYGGADVTPDIEAALRRQAAKRVGLRFAVSESASWDHRKLAGTY